jgi:hypothetical protein
VFGKMEGAVAAEAVEPIGGVPTAAGVLGVGLPAAAAGAAELIGGTAFALPALVDASPDCNGVSYDGGRVGSWSPRCCSCMPMLLK